MKLSLAYIPYFEKNKRRLMYRLIAYLYIRLCPIILPNFC
jgi:hypothetical protein